MPARPYIDNSREFLIVENKRTVHLLDLTAGFDKRKIDAEIASCERRANLAFRAVRTQYTVVVIPISDV